VNERIPDEWQTRSAINSVERVAARGRDPYLAIESAESTIAYVVANGGTLADARTYAIEAALHRDRKLTSAELDVKLTARRQHYPTSSTPFPSGVAAAAVPQTSAAPSGALAASPSAVPSGAPDLITAGAS
jgi:hypothetical protein